MFGKLTLEDIPYHEPIIVVAGAGMILGALAVLGAITYFGKWRTCGPNGSRRSTTRSSA